MKVEGSRKGLLGSLAVWPGYQSERLVAAHGGQEQTYPVVGMQRP